MAMITTPRGGGGGGSISILVCKICGTQFYASQREEAEEHIRTQHPQAIRVTCPLCQRELSDAKPETILAHLTRFHPEITANRGQHDAAPPASTPHRTAPPSRPEVVKRAAPRHERRHRRKH